jgi:hypothetical protein
MPVPFEWRVAGLGQGAVPSELETLPFFNGEGGRGAVLQVMVAPHAARAGGPAPSWGPGG